MASAAQGVAVDLTSGGWVSDGYRAERVRHELCDAFARHDYVKLPRLVPPEIRRHLQTELRRIEGAATVRNFQMEGLETPRVLSTIGGQRLARLSPTLAALYTSTDLRDLVEAVVAGQVYDCANANESLVANFELTVGATHGWHTDDVPYTLVLHVEAPDVGAGGLVEYVPHWRDVCADLQAPPDLDVEPTVERCRQLGLVRSGHHGPGDAYLLRVDTSLHRVTPLIRDGARRAVLVFAYESSPTMGSGAAAPSMYGEL
jgi:hypothetical protein